MSAIHLEEARKKFEEYDKVKKNYPEIHQVLSLSAIFDFNTVSSHTVINLLSFDCLQDKNGSIDKGELRELFVDLFPAFHK